MTAAFVFEEIEPRILYSAELSPAVLAGAMHTLGHESALDAQPLHGAAPATQQLAFVDLSLPDAASLVADLQAQHAQGRPIEVVTIGANQDGLKLIGDTLAAQAAGSVEAVHVLSHGSAGELQLGSATLDGRSLVQQAGAVAGWSKALAPQADLLIYGCDFAADAAGRAVTQGLAALTGADVAASTDLTGAAALGGNWALEYATGPIDAAPAPSAAEEAGWLGTMATYTVTTTADQPGSTPLAGSLRWAIGQANAHAGADVIAFAVNGSFDIAAGSTGDNGNEAGDFDISDSLSLIGNGATATVIHGNGADRVFDVRAGTVSMQGLTVTGGGGTGGGLGLVVRSGAQLQLQQVIVSNNVGSGDGAGIADLGGLTLSNVEIRDNQTGSNGGGLYVAGSAVLIDVTLAGNSAVDGGGLHASGSSTLSNVTASGNSASRYGGGIFSGAGSLILDHVTVADNSAPANGGGGIYQDSLTSSTGFSTGNSIYSNGSGGNLRGPFQSLGYNLLSDLSVGYYQVTDYYSTYIHLSPLADNGGFTRTQAIDVSSGARDLSNPADTSAFDQRGVARYGRADVGAYEYTTQNSAPTISTIAAVSSNEDTPATVNFSIADAETPVANLTLSATSSNPALIRNSDLVFSGSGANRSLTLTPVANANSSVAGPVTITISVSDGSDAGTSSFTVSLLAVNDAPVAVDDVASTPPGVAITVPVLANDSDADGDALAIDSVVVDPALGTVSLAGNVIAFTPAGGVSGPVPIGYQLRDPSNALSNSATLTVNVGTNPAPTSTAPASLQLSEDGSVLIAATDLNYADDNPIGGLRIDALPAQGRLLLRGAPVSLGTTVSVADLAAGLLGFVPLPDGSSNGVYASLQFSVQDALGAYAAAPQRMDFIVSPVNDAPLLDDGRSGNTSALGTPENGAPLPLLAGLLLSDIDSPGLASARLYFDGGAATGEEVLGFANDGRTMGNIQASFDASTGVLTLSSAGRSATLAEWQAALRSASYGNSSDRPSAAPRAISLQVDDGGSTNALSNLLHTSVIVVAQNDAPSAPPLDLGHVDEDSTRSLTVAELLAGASDPDGDALALLNLRISAGDALVTPNGRGWSVTPAADRNGSVELQYEVDDGTVAVTRSASLVVDDVADAPLITLDRLVLAEGGSAVPELQAEDVDSPAAALRFGISDVSHGHFAFVDAPSVATLGFSQADVDAARVRFYSDGGELAPAYRVSVSDGQLGSALSIAQVVYTSVNDAPVVGTIQLGSLASGGTRVITPAELLAASSDAENDALRAGHLVIAVGSGQLTPLPQGGWRFTATGAIADTVQFDFDVSDGQATTVGEAELGVAAALPMPPLMPPAPPALPPPAPPSPAPVPLPLAPVAAPAPPAAAEPAPAVAGLLPNEAAAPSAAPAASPEAEAETAAAVAPREALHAEAGALQLPAASAREAATSAAFAASLSLDLTPSASFGSASFEPTTAPPPRPHAEPAAALALPSEDSHHEAAARSLVDVALALRERSLVEALDRLRHTMEQGQRPAQEAVAAGTVVSAGLSVGYVLWLARGGALVASLVSALPAWAMVDPLPVLSQMKRQADDDAPEDEVESLFARARRFARQAAP